MKIHGAMMRLSKFLGRLLLVTAVVGIGLSPPEVAKPGSRWAGGYFPNVPLLTQDGKTVRFYDDLVKDKVVAINFIYAHCREACPVETANLRRVQELLGDRMGRDVFFYSISIDPEHDTPAVLKEYAEKFKAGPGWTFLTGKKDDVVLLQKKLGLYRGETSAQDISSHNISFMVGNAATGQWIKRSPFDHPKVLARLLGGTLHNFSKPRATALVSYTQAPRLPNMGKGEDLFRSRCQACHSLGPENGLGPGLAGVLKKRERAWLARWLKSPDAVLGEKDPIALQLFEQYNKVLMPNLKLSDSEVEAVLLYLEGQGQHTGHG